MPSTHTCGARLLALALASGLAIGGLVRAPALARDAAKVTAQDVTARLVPSAERPVDLAQLHDRVVETIEKHFHDEALLKRLDWRALAAAARPQIVSAQTLADAARHINALLARLETSHTALYTPDDVEYYILLDVVGASASTELLATRFWGSGPAYAGIGAFTVQLGERHFVDAVLEGSPADRAGLEFGDEIVEVDGEPYSPIAAFRGKAGRTATLRVRHAEATMLDTIGVQVATILPKKAFADATRASARIIERGGKRIGYVHLWASVDSAPLREALGVLNPGIELEQVRRSDGRAEAVFHPAPHNRSGPARLVDGLIIDARGKVGGRAGVPTEYLEMIDPSPRRVRMTARARDGSERASQTVSFKGRSALLIDKKTRSAVEILAHAFKRDRIGPLIGTTTAGAVTAGGGFIMPGELYLYVGVTGLSFDGERLEGKGVAPDIRVERPLPYAGGADPVLEAALKQIAGD